VRIPALKKNTWCGSKARCRPLKLALLNHGLSLDGQALKPAQVSWQNQDQLRFILREGKKRQIRRMCELVGLKVTGLKRVRIGALDCGIYRKESGVICRMVKFLVWYFIA
jgi:16S rRNA U516 pseudouridylate synthase RsuA-like enzyme